MSIFITFEGPDGSGKSTQIKMLADYFTGRGQSIYLTREPGGTVIGERIRDVLHDVAHSEMDAITEILLYSASRAQHVAEIIKPKLAQGTVVLCDRYADSTFAYQGYGRGLDMAMLQSITRFATQSLVPHLTIYLDLPIEVGLHRKQIANEAGEGELNRMDQEAADFHRRVRDGYLAMAHAEPERWLVVDAEQPIDTLHESIVAALANREGETR